MSNVNTELINGFEAARRDSRTQIDDNPFFKEKISDIFVNRNVGGAAAAAVTSNTIGAPLGKLYYGGKVSNSYTKKSIDSASNEYDQQNKAFYLHDVNKPVIDANTSDAKVYNIFSKQRLANSYASGGKNARGISEENSYLAMKVPAAANKQQSQKVPQMKTHATWDSFEDDELTKILG